MNKKLLHQIQQKSTVQDILHRLQKNNIKISTNDHKQKAKDLQYLFANGLAMRSENKSIYTYSITKIGLDTIQDLLKNKLHKHMDKSNNKNKSSKSSKPNKPNTDTQHPSRLKSDHYQSDNAPLKDLISTLSKYFIWILIILIFATSVMFLFLNNITIYHYFGLMIFYIILLLISIIFCS